ncbi:MAG: hypothetical protein ACR2N9_05365 [Acidimicrobiia bacterium]
MSVATASFDLEVDIELMRACEFTSAQRIPSPMLDASLYSQDHGRILLYSFDGGCVRVAFPTLDLASSEAGRALFDEIHLMPRDELRRLTGWEL